MKGLNVKIAVLLTVCLAGLSACNSASGPDADIVVPDEISSKDTTAPKIIDTEVFTIAGRGSYYSITFDEAINVETAEVTVHEGLGDGAEVPTTLVAGTDGKSLAVSGDFKAGMIYFASVDVTDLAGNANDPVSLKFQPPLADADGDGIEDENDKCPDTPAGTSVVDTGCPQLPPAAVDSDADGVADSADKCPGTMKDWVVDKDGCLIVYTLMQQPGYLFPLFYYQPKITYASPADKSENINVNGYFGIYFDVAIDAAEIKAHVKLKQYDVFWWEDVPLEIYTTDSTGTYYSFTHPQLKPGAIYALVVEKGIKTSKGYSTEDIVLTFKTAK